MQETNFELLLRARKKFLSFELLLRHQGMHDVQFTMILST